MAIPNFIAVFALSGVVAKLTKEFFFKGKKGERLCDQYEKE